jgi:hypothetical protein
VDEGGDAEEAAAGDGDAVQGATTRP